MLREGPRSDSHHPTRNAKSKSHKQSPAFWAALTLTSMICLASFVLSFVALADLLHMTGQPRELSYLFPVIIDGTILQATISILWLAGNDDRGRERRFFWVVLAVAAGVSIAGNALHAWVSHAPDFNPVLAAVISTIPPISLLAASHGLTILARTPKMAAVGEGSAVHPQHDADEPAVEPTTPAPAPAVSTSMTHELDTPVDDLHDDIDTLDAAETTTVEMPGPVENATTEPVIPREAPQAASVATTVLSNDPIIIDLSTATPDQLRDYALRRKALGVKPKEIAVEVNRNISTVYRWIDDAAKAVGEPQLVR